MYHKGKAEHASACGGIITIVFYLFMLAYVAKLLYDIFSYNNYSIKEQSHIFKKYFTKEMKIEKFSEMF